MTKRLLAAAIIAATLTLAGCSAPATTAPPVTTEAAAEPSATPTPTPTVEAERGTRANPLAPGEFRKLSDDSAWTVGAEGPTEVHSGYVVLPLRVGIDWESIRKQASDAGQDPASVDAQGIDPYGSLIVRYVTAGGRSYDTFENYDVQIPGQFWEIGTVYPPAETFSVKVPISVPDAEIPGGVWTVLNTGNASVFIATQ